MHLNNRARELLDGYSAGMAQQFGARDASRYFSLNNPQENALRLALLESVEFLDMLTCLDVDQLSGQVISVGSSVLHTGRSESGRFIRQVGVDGNDYSLVETDSPAPRCAGICFRSGQTPVRMKTSFITLSRHLPHRLLHWICCVSALTVRAAQKPLIPKLTRTVKM